MFILAIICYVSSCLYLQNWGVDAEIAKSGAGLNPKVTCQTSSIWARDAVKQDTLSVQHGSIFLLCCWCHCSTLVPSISCQWESKVQYNLKRVIPCQFCFLSFKFLHFPFLKNMKKEEKWNKEEKSKEKRIIKKWFPIFFYNSYKYKYIVTTYLMTTAFFTFSL